MNRYINYLMMKASMKKSSSVCSLHKGGNVWKIIDKKEMHDSANIFFFCFNTFHIAIDLKFWYDVYPFRIFSYSKSCEKILLKLANHYFFFFENHDMTILPLLNKNCSIFSPSQLLSLLSLCCSCQRDILYTLPQMLHDPVVWKIQIQICYNKLIW